jgi:hypothetical protein
VSEAGGGGGGGGGDKAKVEVEVEVVGWGATDGGSGGLGRKGDR